MDSEFLVDNSLSEEKSRRGGNIPPFSLTFEEQFPYYLAIGMTYEQYWEEDCTLVKAYRKAEEIRQKKFNQESWWQGIYIYEALCNVSPIFNPYAKKGTKPLPYPNKPYDFTEDEREKTKEKEQELIHAKGLGIMTRLMGDMNKKLGKEVKNE